MLGREAVRLHVRAAIGGGEGLAGACEWQGTRDVSAWLTIPKAIEFMASLGWERVRAYEASMAEWANRDDTALTTD